MSIELTIATYERLFNRDVLSAREFSTGFLILVIDAQRLADGSELARLLPLPGLNEKGHLRYTAGLEDLDLILAPFFGSLDAKNI